MLDMNLAALGLQGVTQPSGPNAPGLTPPPLAALQTAQPPTPTQQDANPFGSLPPMSSPNQLPGVGYQLVGMPDGKGGTTLSWRNTLPDATMAAGNQ